MLFTAEFWVAASFVAFLLIAWKLGAFKQAADGLDARANAVRSELAEAKRLREEAETMLTEYEAKRRVAEKQAEEIVAAAQEEAKRLAAEAEAKMAEFVKRRTAQAEQRIAQAELQAAAEVRAAAADAATRAAESILRGDVKGAMGENLVRQGLKTIAARAN
jgi:F-type H+-transporting ATPase subunit b